MPTNRQSDYDHDYPTCQETYSTLRIFSEDVTPEEITKILRFQPTKSFLKGEVHGKQGLQYKTNGWLYCTKELVTSRDSRRHIDLILSKIEESESDMATLLSKGCEIDIFSYWVSRGQGGPALWPEQMVKLGSLRIEIGWDIYFSREEEPS